MPNIAAVLKDEISRIARKEMRKVVDPLRKQVVSLKRDNASLKRENAQLRREMSALSKARNAVAEPVDTAADAPSHRFSATGLKKLRARLGLSAAALGSLLDASALSVYNWENGKVRPRAATVERIAALRSSGKAAVQQMLEGLAPAKKGGRARKSGKSRPQGKSRKARKSTSAGE